VSVKDIITGALRLLGVYGAIETPEPEDLADGLNALNELINEWNAEHLAMFAVTNRSLPLTAGTQEYTIGIGGTFNVPRPLKIESAGIVQTNKLRSDLKLDTAREWRAIPEKTVAARLPLRLYCDNDYPVSTLRIWPVPSQPCTLDMDVWEGLDDAQELSFEVKFPPAYARALRYGLAVAVAPEYGVDPGPIAAIAAQAKQKLIALNASTFSGTEDPPQPAA
jgi:hypothetical protein